MAKALEDARDGLIRYWQLRPSGGTRTELIALAIQQGFEEPLLNEWLDVFLQGFVKIRALGVTTANYDLGLAPKVASEGFVAARDAALAVFRWLTDNSGSLDLIRKENTISQHDAGIAAAIVDRDLVVQGRAWISANVPAGAVKTATLAAVDRDLAAQQRAIDSVSDARQRLADELAAQG